MSWEIAAAGALVVYGLYQWNKKKAAKNASFIYYTSIKPALESLGFIGSPGDVHENPSEIDSLYYLKPSKVFNSIAGVKFKIAEDSDAHWIEFQPAGGSASGSKYQITFSTELNDHRSKSELSLRIINPELEKELPHLSAPIVNIYAPTHFFNRANLEIWLGRVALDIQSFEQSGEIKPYWLFDGINMEGVEKIFNLSRVTRDSPKDLRNKAGKIIKKGYPH